MDEKSAISLLKKHSSDDKSYEIVLAHSKAVQKLALSIADRIIKAGKAKPDVAFIRTATLLHDIGRFANPPGTGSIKHGIAGAELLRKEGVDERYALVCERHLGAGITKEEIVKKKLPLPAKNYIPVTLEEKIIAHADNLLWGTKIVPAEMVIERFTNEIDRKAGERVKALIKEIEELT